MKKILAFAVVLSLAASAASAAELKVMSGSLLDRIGIKDVMQGKLKPMSAEGTVEVVARGEADIVVVVATRITGVAGDMVGLIPEKLQTKIGFVAGLSASTKELDAAKLLIRLLSAPSAAPTLKANGVEPI